MMCPLSRVWPRSHVVRRIHIEKEEILPKSEFPWVCVVGRSSRLLRDAVQVGGEKQSEDWQLAPLFLLGRPQDNWVLGAPPGTTT